MRVPGGMRAQSGVPPVEPTNHSRNSLPARRCVSAWAAATRDGMSRRSVGSSFPGVDTNRSIAASP